MSVIDLNIFLLTKSQMIIEYCISMNEKQIPIIYNPIIMDNIIQALIYNIEQAFLIEESDRI